ncbi:MAG: hypothetical protein R3Y33_03115 [Clostridia bacterium]
MIGREDKKTNDLFFTCSLIEYMARKTKNNSKYIANKLGRERLEKIYDLADVYHCENIDKVSYDFIQDSGIENGSFDNIISAKYNVPSHFDIGKIYKRLIIGIAKEKNISIIDALLFAYNSKMSDKINDYNCAFYYDSPQNILIVFLCDNMLGNFKQEEE